MNIKERLGVPFTQVANSVLNDKRLSLSAKGLFAYIYSKPETWDFSYLRIANDHPESKNTILKLLTELKNCGYLTRQKHSNGKMSYRLTYEPDTKLWREAKPSTKIAKHQNSQLGSFGVISNKERDSNKEGDSNTSAKPSLRTCAVSEIKTLFGSEVEVRASDPIAEVIKAFEAVDPKNKSYYGNKTQRNACGFLIDTYSFETVIKVVTTLPKTNQEQFYPVITSPFELKEKWEKLKSAFLRGQSKSKNALNNFIW